MISSTGKVDHMMGICRDKQYALNEIRDALILYCQQFAFAPEMAYQCSALLKCAQTQLPTKYAFPGDGGYESHYEAHGGGLNEDHHHGLSSTAHSGSDSSYSNESHVDPYSGDSQHHHDDQPEPLSSHGMELYKTGGHVKPAYQVDPELAAAAVSPHEAVIQVGDRSITAPFDHIDTDKVELACYKDGACALIPNDGNPYNDITLTPNDHIRP